MRERHECRVFVVLRHVTSKVEYMVHELAENFSIKLFYKILISLPTSFTFTQSKATKTAFLGEVIFNR